MNSEQFSALCPKCRDALALLARKNHPNRVGQIVEEVSMALNIPAADILGDSRKRQVAHARQTVMYFAREEGRSLNAIGHVLNRDHTTVLHGANAAEQRIKELSQ